MHNYFMELVLEAADIATEMLEIRHLLKKRIPGQIGIEF